MPIPVWCLQRRRRYFIARPIRLRLQLSPGKPPKFALTSTIVARRVSSSNLSSSKRSEAGIKTPSISSRRWQPKDLDDGALQTLSQSNNSSSDSQSSFREATQPSCLSVTQNLWTMVFKRNFPKNTVWSPRSILRSLLNLLLIFLFFFIHCATS